MSGKEGKLVITLLAGNKQRKVFADNERKHQLHSSWPNFDLSHCAVNN